MDVTTRRWLLGLWAVAFLVAGCSGDGKCLTAYCLHVDGWSSGVDLGAARETTAPRSEQQKSGEAAAPYVHEDVPVQKVDEWMKAGKAMTLIDVREPSEYQTGHLQGAINLAWTSGVLKQQVGTISKSVPVVVYCHSGVRSNAAATFLAGQGFKPVYDMMGGIAAWQAAGLPVVQ